MKAFLGSIGCFLAAIAFGVTAGIGLPLGLKMAVTTDGPPHDPLQNLMFALVFFGLLLPFVVALCVAYLFREPVGRSHYMRNALTWVVALIAGPAVLMILSARDSNEDARRYAENLAWSRRPIAVTDTAGLCAPPVYGSENGIPTVRLTARVPTAGPYGFQFDATDHAGLKLEGFQKAECEVGVHEVTLRARRAASADSLPGSAVQWPVVITHVSVRDMTPDSEWKDYRAADTLALLAGP